LAAALIGVTLAIVLRERDIPPRKRYSWEDEADAPDDDGLDYDDAPAGSAGEAGEDDARRMRAGA
ncbi:MAG: hypothetical protein ABI593_00820, partial [Betaproteobacteria bacterium]